MTVEELIKELMKLPPNEKVYRDGGEYKDDYIQIGLASLENLGWGQKGVVIR